MKGEERTFLERIGGRLFPKGKKHVHLPENPDEALFVVLDTETTGLDPVRDRILSIGALRLRAGRIRVRDSFECLVEQEHFDRNSVPIHGILRGGSQNRLPEREALQDLKHYIADGIVVGHHIAFDRAVIQNGWYRHGLGEMDNPMLDTGILYRKSLIKSPLLHKKDHYSLDDLARKFDLSCKDRHTALGDAYITALAFLRILEQLRKKHPLTLSQLLKMGKPG